MRWTNSATELPDASAKFIRVLGQILALEKVSMPASALKLHLIRQRLQHYERLITELIAFLGHRPRLTRPDLAYARDRLRRIKGDLKRDDQTGNTDRRFAALTPAEQLYFHHVVNQAMVAIESPWNSHPVATQWIQQLEDALCNFHHALSQLDHMSQKSLAP